MYIQISCLECQYFVPLFWHFLTFTITVQHLSIILTYILCTVGGLCNKSRKLDCSSHVPGDKDICFEFECQNGPEVRASFPNLFIEFQPSFMLLLRDCAFSWFSCTANVNRKTVDENRIGNEIVFYLLVSKNTFLDTPRYS